MGEADGKQVNKGVRKKKLRVAVTARKKIEQDVMIEGDVLESGTGRAGGERKVF